MEEAIARYHDLLLEKHLEGTRKGLARATREHDLTFLGVPLCGVLRPYLISFEELESVSRAASLVMRGLNALTRALMSDAGLRAGMGLAPQDEAVVRNDSPEPKEIVGRLDGFVGGTEAKFIEFNPRPASLFEHDRMPQVFASLPVMRDFARGYEVESESIEDGFVDTLAGLRRRFAAEGHAAVTVIGEVLDAADREFRAQARSLQAVLGRAEWKVALASPKSLEVRDGGVFRGEREVGPAYVANWERLQRRLPFAHPFWKAAREGRVWLANSLASTVLRGNKACFAYLSDPRFEALYEPEVARALAAHVPWTRVLRPGATLWQGETVDLVPFVRAHRERFVLKPAASYGGKGVVLGWACDDARWAGALDRALADPHVVQERVMERRQAFPASVEGKLDIREYLTDLNCFVWGTDRVQGYMARVSPGPLMNMTAGAGTCAPVFKVRPRRTGPSARVAG